MKDWVRSSLRIIFAIVIMFLAAAIGLFARVIFHSQNERLFGIVFLAAYIALFLLFEKLFPSVYTYGNRWWQRLGRAYEGIFAVAFALIVSILSSKVATLWFGLLAISGVGIALLLRMTRRDGEL